MKDCKHKFSAFCGIENIGCKSICCNHTGRICYYCKIDKMDVKDE